MNSACGLLLSDLSMSFGGLRVLSNISLRIQAGERRAIVGPNGAGKTTLFHVICGDLQPTSGQIALMGQDVTRLPTHRRAQMGLARTFQKNNLFTGLSVLENAMLTVQSWQGKAGSVWAPGRVLEEIEARALEALDMVGLAGRAKSPVSLLSYGEQRQLEIALALAVEPRILLLDEPTAGMSPAETERTADLIRSLPEGLTLVIIEHDMDVISSLAESMTVLHYGEVLAEGTVDEVRRNDQVMRVYLGHREEVPA